MKNTNGFCYSVLSARWSCSHCREQRPSPGTERGIGAMESSPAGIVAEEKRMKIICLECVFLFSSNFAGGHIYSWRERCDILACHLCSKGQSSAGTAFIVLFAPLYFFLQCVNFMVVEKMKSCFWNKQQHKPANCAQHNGILMYSSCWHSVFLW